MEDKILESITMDAIMKAYEAFSEYLENEGYDPAFWDVRFTSWLLSADFTDRLSKVEYEREIKDD